MADDFFYARLDNLLGQIIPPGCHPDSDDITTATLLRLFGFVYLNIEMCRKELSLSTPLPYDRNADLAKLHLIDYKLTPNDHTTLNKYALRIVDTVYLSDKWIMPVKVAILTHTLPVPEDPLVTFHSTFSRDTPNGFKRLFRRSIIYDNSVVIEVHRQPASLKELCNVLEKQIDILGPMLSQLPIRPSTDMKRDKGTLTWGRLAFIYKTDYKGVHWSTIRADIEEIAERLKTEVKGLPPPPDTDQDLIKLWQNFKKSLKLYRPS